MNQVGSAPSCEQTLELGAQFVCRLEFSVDEVQLPETVQRAGNVARDGIDRLLFTGITFGRARIDQRRSFVADVLAHELRVHVFDQSSARLEVPARSCRHRAAGWTRRGNPSLPSAVEQSDARMPEPAREPPQPNRKLAPLRVIRDQLAALVHTPAAKQFGEFSPCRQRVTAVFPGLWSR